MYDELTQVDIDKMKAEIDYRMTVLRPKLIEDVKTARAFGDLSENFEYKAAKQEQRKNMSRIRYLKRMLASAVVIDASSAADVAGLFDRVTLFMEDEGEEMTIRLVTTLRQNALEGLISKESPLGQAVMGHRVGDRVQVQVRADYSYWAEIRAIEKGEDDDTLEIRPF
jgi:transcription elongation factor GreA